ncbi:MAG: DinB family protein [Chloroflexi bacterium]|nr:DinB family protein [Chloroflexota bacterium]
MKTATLTTLFSHNLWANLRLLEQCAALTSEQLDATISGAFGSIRDTLRHIVLAEQGYFSRISTGQPRHQAKSDASLTITDMLESVRRTGTGLIEWAPRVNAEETVQVDWEGTPRDVPKTIFLTQVINHATEHRAHLMANLTQLGIQPPDLDAWTYFDQLKGSLGRSRERFREEFPISGERGVPRWMKIRGTRRSSRNSGELETWNLEPET